MLTAGDPLPPIAVWVTPGGDPVGLDQLAAKGPFLLFFYLYDWSAT